MNWYNTSKYLHLKFEGKNPFKIVNEISLSGKLPLTAVKKIRDISSTFFSRSQRNCNYFNL